MFDHLVLAGGGHTHALILKRWAMNPRLKPNCLVTLISRDSSTIYSGMFPGVVSGHYLLDQALIDLRLLANSAGVSLIVGEITSLDLKGKRVFISNRPPVAFSRLSLDVGSETFLEGPDYKTIKNTNLVFSIRPFRQALEKINSLDRYSNLTEIPFTVVGSGLAALEIAFALRQRWPNRPLKLKAIPEKLNTRLQSSLRSQNIQIQNPNDLIDGPSLFCTGSRGPKWLMKSGLKVNPRGRVITKNTFEVIGGSDVFAVGDCGLLDKYQRPPSGVWAVRAADPLAKNLERSFAGKKLFSWKPQPFGLQLLGGLNKRHRLIAWAFFGKVIVGPSRFFWILKERIDRNFVESFHQKKMMQEKNENILCRGCAAKIGAEPLKDALSRSGFSKLASYPEDAAVINSFSNGEIYLQSVDGFPALLNDPWLNARLTALHACSDIWARGGHVHSAQALITIPALTHSLQAEVLYQCLEGIKSALDPQQAELLGGHTFESRAELGNNTLLDIEISLAVNGYIKSGGKLLGKAGMKPGDEILISREIGNGVIFAAAMQGKVSPDYVDMTFSKLSTSQHFLLDEVFERSGKLSEQALINACTDITGFGLLGHLGEMLDSTNKKRLADSLPLIKVKLFGSSIPSMVGAKKLLRNGVESTLASSNMRFCRLLDLDASPACFIDLIFEKNTISREEIKSIKKLIIDPQTCGPLVISCHPLLANDLIENSSWNRIGKVDEI